LEIILDKNSAIEGLIKVTLKETDYQPKVEEKVKEYSRKAQIKGFRPGKVPPTLIKKMYGKTILIEEINELLSKSVIDYIKQNDIKIIGDPLPVTEKTANINWDIQKEFQFEYMVGLVDSFSVDYTLKIDSYDVEVDEPTIKETIDRLKREYGTYSEPAEYGEGDDVFGDIIQTGATNKTEVWLIHDQLSETERTKLAGIKKDDTIKVNIENLFKEISNLAKAMRKTEEEAKNLAGEYELKVTRIHRVEPAGINQEFYDKVFGKDIIKTEEEFLSKLKETVQKNYKHETDHYTEHSIQDKLIDSTKIELPENFYKKWILATNKGKVTEEDINKNLDKYLKELKWSLIFNRVSEDSSIKVEHEDVLSHAKDLIRSQFAAYGIPQNEDENIDTFANNYLKGREGENYFTTYNQVKSGKVMNVLKEKLQITYKKVNPAEFLEIIKENK